MQPIEGWERGPVAGLGGLDTTKSAAALVVDVPIALLQVHFNLLLGARVLRSVPCATHSFCICQFSSLRKAG